jgi:hypothetical protein
MGNLGQRHNGQIRNLKPRVVDMLNEKGNAAGRLQTSYPVHGGYPEWVVHDHLANEWALRGQPVDQLLECREILAIRFIFQNATSQYHGKWVHRLRRLDLANQVFQVFHRLRPRQYIKSQNGGIVVRRAGKAGQRLDGCLVDLLEIAKQPEGLPCLGSRARRGSAYTVGLELVQASLFRGVARLDAGKIPDSKVGVGEGIHSVRAGGLQEE